MPIILPLVDFRAFFILENESIGYAVDSTLMAVVPSQCVRVTVAESLIRDLGRISEWCDFWGMKLNASKNNILVTYNASPITIINYWQTCSEGV